MKPVPTSIAFFNNKGGVGKTTLACNFAANLAADGKSVVVVDCDPQSNATQLLLSEEVWESIYSDRTQSEKRTLMRAMRFIRAGDSGVDTSVELQSSVRFGVQVLAGHPSLSTVEDRLSASWAEFGAGFLGGARRSLWARELVRDLDCEIVIFDLGPSLGALNRSVLAGSDYFVTPVAADLFSLYALENIGDWLHAWLAQYSNYLEKLNASASELTEYSIPTALRIARGWSGYSVQQYVAKTTGGKVREVQAYDRYKKEIPARAAQLHDVQSSSLVYEELGVVPNMFSMIPLAQAAHAPIADLRPSDGIRGAQVTQQKKYVDQLNVMFGRLKKNLEL